MEVSDKVSKKDMEQIDVSTKKDVVIDLNYVRSRYLGGDNDKFEGFYDSQDEIEFENFKAKGKKGTNEGNGGIFGKLTSAFKNITGNKVIGWEDVEPIMLGF